MRMRTVLFWSSMVALAVVTQLYGRTGVPAEPVAAEPVTAAPPNSYVVNYVVLRAQPNDRSRPRELDLQQKLAEGLDRRSPTPKFVFEAPGKPGQIQAFVDSLNKLTPGFSYKAITRGEKLVANGGTVTLQAGPEKGDPRSVALQNHMTVEGTGPTTVEVRSKGEVTYRDLPAVDQGGWNWDGRNPQVTLGQPIFMGGKTLQDGSILLFLYSVTAKP
jgi:hypothetical protein